VPSTARSDPRASNIGFYPRILDGWRKRQVAWARDPAVAHEGSLRKHSKIPQQGASFTYPSTSISAGAAGGRRPHRLVDSKKPVQPLSKAVRTPLTKWLVLVRSQTVASLLPEELNPRKLSLIGGQDP
jgi:hypothetical protein